MNDKMISIDVATWQIDKMLKRIQASAVIDEIFKHDAPPFAINTIFSSLNRMYETDAFGHDRGETDSWNE